MASPKDTRSEWLTITIPVGGPITPYGLKLLAGQLSTPDRRARPMQVAAQVLETSVEQLVEEDNGAR